MAIYSDGDYLTLFNYIKILKTTIARILNIFTNTCNYDTFEHAGTAKTGFGKRT
jgi:hypothetical protein